jgi:hypothetical protein
MIVAAEGSMQRIRMVRRAIGRRRLLRALAALAAVGVAGGCTPGDITSSGSVYRSRTRSLRNQGGGRRSGQ